MNSWPEGSTRLVPGTLSPTGWGQRLKKRMVPAAAAPPPSATRLSREVSPEPERIAMYLPSAGGAGREARVTSGSFGSSVFGLRKKVSLPSFVRQTIGSLSACE